MKKYFQLVVIIIVCICLVFVAYKYWSKISLYQWNLPLLLSIFIPIFMVVKFLVAVIGGLLLKEIKIDISIWEGAKIFLLSAPTRYVPGKLWPFVSKIYLSKSRGVLKGHMAFGTILEVLLLLVSAISVFFSLLPFSGKYVDSIIYSHHMFVIIICLIFSLILIHPKVISHIVKKIAAKKKLSDLIPLENIKYRDIFLVFLSFYFYWFIFGTAVFLIINWVIPLKLSFMPMIIGANAVGWVIGYLSIISPAGFGVREGIIVWLLRDSLPVPDLTIIVFMIRFLLIMADMILAALIFLEGKRASRTGNV